MGEDRDSRWPVVFAPAAESPLPSNGALMDSITERTWPKVSVAGVGAILETNFVPSTPEVGSALEEYVLQVADDGSDASFPVGPDNFATEVNVTMVLPPIVWMVAIDDVWLGGKS